MVAKKKKKEKKKEKEKRNLNAFEVKWEKSDFRLSDHLIVNF
jgi:hypothetical protein